MASVLIIAGTAGKCATRALARVWASAAGSPHVGKASGVPASSSGTRHEPMPYEWVRGIAAIVTSSGRTPMVRMIWTVSAASCRSPTAIARGMPVEPEVSLRIAEPAGSSTGSGFLRAATASETLGKDELASGEPLGRRREEAGTHSRRSALQLVRRGGRVDQRHARSDEAKCGEHAHEVGTVGQRQDHGRAGRHERREARAQGLDPCCQRAAGGDDLALGSQDRRQAGASTGQEQEPADDRAARPQASAPRMRASITSTVA